MSNLMIIESPGKVKALNKYLGSGWNVVASVGHIRDLPPKEMGVSGPDYIPKYEMSAKTGVMPKLKAAVAKADVVYIAADPDREGEAIAWHLYESLNLANKKTHRVVFNKITEDEVKKAVNSPTTIDMDMVMSQQGRRVLDRYVGYMVSPYISDIANQRLSAGRVQSVAVKIVAERCIEIDNFVPTDHFGVNIELNGHKASWVTKPFLKGDDKYVLDRSLAEKVQAVTQVKTVSCDDKDVSKAPPAPFITSTMCRESANKLRMSSPSTMKAAQRLYDLGLITYHRTDNLNYSDKGIGLLRDEMVSRGKGDDLVESTRTWKNKADAQGAHESIRPTDFGLDAKSIEDESCRKVYELILNRALASQMKDAVFLRRSVEFEALDHLIDGKSPLFKASTSTLQYAGWKSLYEDSMEAEDNAGDEDFGAIPKYESGSKEDVEKAIVTDKKTKPPALYTESTLLKKLEDEGVGRPSTYASIIGTIVGKRYVSVSNMKFTITASGSLIYQMLNESFDFMDIGFTKRMESSLDEIAGGNEGLYKKLLSDCEDSLRSNLSMLKREDFDIQVKEVDCPKCDDGKLTEKPGKGKSTFWGCSNYKTGTCKATFANVDGDPYLDKPDCLNGDCDSTLELRQGKFGLYFTCNANAGGCGTNFNYGPQKEPVEKKKVETNLTDHDCPKCGSKLKKVPKKAKGYFFPCSKEKDKGCNFAAFEPNKGDLPTYKDGNDWKDIEGNLLY